MKTLILGGSGMLGHKLWQTCAPRIETYVTLRGAASNHAYASLFDPSRTIENINAEDFATVRGVIERIQPDVMVNCIGIVKQGSAVKDPIASIIVNSLFPHRLAALARETEARLIHLSTDCVFSGRMGYYAESDLPDAEDLYGRSKLLGEVTEGGALMIRTSMIGRELEGTQGLLEWFLAQSETVRGFKRAIFSGFTTNALAEVIYGVIVDHRELEGLWHIGSDPISKFDLLSLVKQIYGLATEIVPDETFVCDRSLNGERFRAATGFKPPSWPEMIARMNADRTPYDEM